MLEGVIFRQISAKLLPKTKSCGDLVLGLGSVAARWLLHATR